MEPRVQPTGNPGALGPLNWLPSSFDPRYQELCFGFAELGLSAGSTSIKTRFHLVEVFAQLCSVPFTHLRDVSIRRYSQVALDCVISVRQLFGPTTRILTVPTPIPHVLSISRICLESLEIGYLFVSDDWLAPGLSAFDLSELKFLRLMPTSLDFYATVGKFHKDRDLFVYASTQPDGMIIDLGLLPQLVLLRMSAMNMEAGEMLLDTLSTITQSNRNRSITIHSTNPALYAELDPNLANLPMRHALTVELAMDDPRYGVIAHMHHFPRLLAKIWSAS
ncbi:hypothetical protein DFH09DRAFT_1275759 [Mycena vulgaris]|nr:hypothetical protein DFH09DRAFT_1275759 [Mycena vulgaris]